MFGKMPSPPDDLPKYFAEGIPKQDTETLEALQDWLDALLEHRQNIDPSEITVGANEQIEDVEQDSDGTHVVKKVPCGKDNCSTCPHGPYLYLVKRKDGNLVWDYQGRVEN
ncbi:hypothetical protein [Halorientalis salina]|uniref:hypothetical protein n=1 Tax=Halorientalis salina TaxID=2932266 RepID=UPI002022A92A|nr:hypothetical protein [Halorientalis salina]